MENFGTEPRKLTYTNGPDTSREAAKTVKSSQYEELAYELILARGLNGCILDELRDGFRQKAPKNTQFVNRRTGLHQKGLVVDSGLRRAGESGKQQAVYIARVLLRPVDIEWIKSQPHANNPCLEGETSNAT